MRRALALLVLALSACSGGESGTSQARADAARESAAGASAMRFTTLGPASTGLDLVTTCGRLPSTQILEVNGGGLGLIDYDRDGDLDLFVANGATLDSPQRGPGSRLYQNRGGLRFADITEAAGIDLRRWAMGVSVGDVDGDGWDDLYVTCYGPNALLRNAGGRFVDITQEAGVGNPGWGTSSAFGDLDGDGDLDLYSVNYLEFDAAHPPGSSWFKGVPVMAGPHGLVAQHDVLYENLGGGKFRDISEPSGCRAVEPSYGLGAAIVDFDLDGRQDIVVGNDSMPNHLFHNLGGMRFEEVGLYSGIAAGGDGVAQATMGIGIADVDDNGYPDVFTTNFSNDVNTLHANLDGTFFDDRSAQYGLGMVSRPFLGWSCGFFDFDLDGDEDLLLFNGHVYPQATMETMDSPYEQVPLLFAREGPRFERVTDPASGDFLREPRRDRAAVFGDLDGDGDVDVVVSELNGPIRVLRNDQAGGAWLTVELDDGQSPGNRRGLGARVRLTCGDRVQQRWIYSGGIQCSNAPRAYFGLLGPQDAGVCTVEVTWPDSGRQEIAGVAPNQHLVVRR